MTGAQREGDPAYQDQGTRPLPTSIEADRLLQTYSLWATRSELWSCITHDMPNRLSGPRPSTYPRSRDSLLEADAQR